MYISAFPVIKCVQELNINLDVTDMEKEVEKQETDKEGSAIGTGVFLTFFIQQNIHALTIQVLMPFEQHKVLERPHPNLLGAFPNIDL